MPWTEYSSILVGTRLPDEVVEGDEHIGETGDQAEGIKELNREIGKRLAVNLDAALISKP